MTERSNEATPLRPEGDRVLNACSVTMNLYQFIEQLKSETTWKDSDRNSITVFKSERVTIVLVGLHENAELKNHPASGIISLQILEGLVSFMDAGQTIELQAGGMIALHHTIPHLIALKETFCLLTVAQA